MVGPRRLIIVAAALILLGAALAAPAALHAQQTAIGIDADPTGNTATSLGPIDSCVEVPRDGAFQVDLFVRDVSDLLAWSAYLEFDPEIVQVVDHDVELFQAANSGSNLFDVSDKTPDTDGVYSVGAVDTADPQAPDSGAGVLARVTLEAVGSGVSSLRLALRDLDGDGTPDQGALLRRADGEIIGDETGDTFFDGPIAGAEVAVGRSCPQAEDDDLNPFIIIGPAIGGVAIIVFAALAALLILRRRSSPA